MRSLSPTIAAHTGQLPAAAALSRLIAEIKTIAVPEQARHAARRHIADTLGVMVASSAMPFGHRPVSRPGRIEAGGATAIGLDVPQTAGEAALVNGILAHGLDFDDTHQPSIMHVGCVVVPAALAVAEAMDAPDDAIERAVVAGYETATRLGAATPGAFHLKGFHPTSIFGALSAAIVTGMLHDLDEVGLAHALGVAGSFSAGLEQFLDDGSDTKRLHAGWAANAGIRAAEFVEMGFQGPAGVLDGRFGIYATHVGLDGYQREQIDRPLGRFSVTETSLKPYPCCHLMHAHIDALVALRQEHDLRAEDVREVRARVHGAGFELLTLPAGEKRRPSSSYSGQFSLPWALAVTLVDGQPDINTFAGERWKDRSLDPVIDRVSCHLDEESRYPLHFDGLVEVEMNDGTIFRHRESVNRGSPERPMSDGDVADKFIGNLRFAGIDGRDAATVAESLLDCGSIVAAMQRANDLTVGARRAQGSPSTIV